MSFLFPDFAWAFLSLGVILFLYLLKRRYEDRPVPSTFLWQKTIQDMTASHPFQRLKRNLLLPLHLLMAALAALILMQPVLSGGTTGETVMIFDLSASMQATDGTQTRLEKAVGEAQHIIDGMGSQNPLTILAASSETLQLLSRSTDRVAARQALTSLETTNTACDLTAAVSLAQAMQRETEGIHIIVFSDAHEPEGNITSRNAEKGLENRAVLSFTVENGQGYARVMNYGGETDVTLACYAEEALCDAKTLHLPAGASAGATLQVPDCAYATVVIQEKDAIAADNRLSALCRGQKRFKVALCGQNSVFLEYAIGLRKDITLLKVEENWQEVEADLYVYREGGLFFSRNPKQQRIVSGLTYEPEGAMQLEAEHPVTKNLMLKDVALRAGLELHGGTPLVTMDGHSLLAVDEGVAALGFSLNESNLPMKADFPILVQNILAWLLPEEDGQELGISTERVIPLEESDVRQVAPSVDGQGGAVQPSGGVQLAPWLLVVFLVLLLVEWGVSRRGC